MVELLCAKEDKMALIRRVAEEGTGVADVEMMPPGLDEIYAHVLRLHEAAP